MWELIVSVPDHCLSFYLSNVQELVFVFLFVSGLLCFCFFLQNVIFKIMFLHKHFEKCIHMTVLFI